MSAEAQKTYREKYPERCKESFRKWRLKHPKRSILYRKTFTGCFSEVYGRIRNRCNGGNERYTGMPLMNRDEWRKFLEDTVEDRKVLWGEWVASGYRLRMAPSIDRIDSAKGYIVGNCRWLPQWENSSRGGKGRRSK